MKRIPAVLMAVVAMAFAATVALADDATSTTPATPAPAAKSTSTTTHHSSSKSKTTHPKVDLNAASKEDLMKLPGVDDALADKIIAARPFKHSSELESKNVVTKEQYTKLSAHVMVAPPAKTASTSK